MSRYINEGKNLNSGNCEVMVFIAHVISDVGSFDTTVTTDRTLTD